jgi:hypothetical protein
MFLYVSCLPISILWFYSKDTLMPVIFIVFSTVLMLLSWLAMLALCIITHIPYIPFVFQFTFSLFAFRFFPLPSWFFVKLNTKKWTANVWNLVYEFISPATDAVGYNDSENIKYMKSLMIIYFTAVETISSELTVKSMSDNSGVCNGNRIYWILT